MNWLKIFRPVSVDAAKEPAPKGAATIPPPALRPLPVPKPVVAAKIERARLVLAVDATASRAAAWASGKAIDGCAGRNAAGRAGCCARGAWWRPRAYIHRVYRKCRHAAQEGGSRQMHRRHHGTARCAGVGAEDWMCASSSISATCSKSSSRKARRLAEALLLKNTRVIILHDGGSPEDSNGQIFQEIASITGGAVLPFDVDAIDELGELLQAIAVLAVGGTELVEEKQDTMPAAPVLLERLAESKQLLLGNGKR